MPPLSDHFTTTTTSQQDFFEFDEYNSSFDSDMILVDSSDDNGSVEVEIGLDDQTKSHRSSITSLASSKRWRRVRFAGYAQEFDELHINDYTREEAEACWYTRSESRAMKERTIRELRCLRSLKDANSMANYLWGASTVLHPDFCTRGLEERLREQIAIRTQRRKACTRAVLNEQALQRNEISSDPEFIATLCARETWSSVEVARQRALQDAKEAIYTQPDTPSIGSEHTQR